MPSLHISLTIDNITDAQKARLYYVFFRSFIQNTQGRVPAEAYKARFMAIDRVIGMYDRLPPGEQQRLLDEITALNRELLVAHEVDPERILLPDSELMFDNNPDDRIPPIPEDQRRHAPREGVS